MVKVINRKTDAIYKILGFLLSLYLVVHMGAQSVGFLVLFLIVMYILMIFKSDNFLLVSTVILSLLSCAISQYSQIGSYIPTILTLLLIIKTVLNLLRYGEPIKMSINMNFVVFLLIGCDFIAMIGSNVPTNFMLIVYAILKKYSFYIMLFFVYNSNCDEKVLKYIDRILVYCCYLNFIDILIQFNSGTSGDYLNGFLGYKANGIVLQIFCFAILRNMNSIKGTLINKIHFFLLSICLLIYAAIAEVKVGFVVLFAVVVVSFIFHMKKAKSLIVLISFLIIINLCYGYLVQLYPKMNFLDSGFMEKYLTESYSGDGTISRLNYMKDLERTVINNDFELIFGHGTGTLNDNIGILKGGLIDKYGYMKIQWFSTPYLIVENGILGLVLFICIYICLLINASKKYLKYKDPFIFQIIEIIVVSMIILFTCSQLTNIYGCIYLLWVYLAFYIRKYSNLGVAYDNEQKRSIPVFE